MSVSYASNRVTIGTYKSGTTTADSTTNLQITSGEIASGDVGRLVAVIPSTGNSKDVQVRRITGVSGGTISIHDPWVGTIASGTTWRVAHTLQDVHDIGDTNLEKIGTSTYRWNADWYVNSTGFLGDVDKALEMTSGEDPAYVIENGGIVQFGILYGGEGFGTETILGCRLHIRTTASNVSTLNGTTTRAANGLVLNYYGCLIESSDNGYQFQRMRGPVRYIGCVVDGPMGGRFYHEGSEWVSSRMSGNENPTGALSIGATFDRDIDDVFSFRNVGAMKTFENFGGTLRNTTFANNTYILLRQGSSGSTVNFIDCTEFDSGDLDDNGGVLNQYRSVVINTTDATGASLSGVAFRLNNVVDTTQGSIQVSDASGNMDEVLALRRKHNHGSTSMQTFDPFRIRYRKYGYLWQELNAAIAAPIKQGVAMLVDDAVTQASGTAAGHTGITVTDHGGSPVTWNGLNWGITVTVDGPSAEDVKHYLHYHLSQTAAFSGKASGLHWHELIPAMSDETQRADYGGTFKGVRIVDTSGNPVPGFNRFQSDDGTYYSPPVTFTLQLSGLESGSQVVVYDSGTTTILDSTNSSGTSYTYSDTGTAPTVDYTVLKGGFLPIRVTGIELSGGTIVAQDPGQSGDRPYDSAHGLTYSTDWSVSIATGEITVNNPTTGQSIYSALIDAYIDRESDTANTEFPLSMDGNASLTLDGMEFASGSIDNLSRTGFRYLDSGSLTAVYAAIQTTTLPSGTKLFASRSDGGTWTLWTTGTGYDGMLQMFGDSNHGSFDGRDFLTLKAVNDGYTVDEWNLTVDGGVPEVVDNFYFVPLSIELTDEATGDPGVTVTVTNITDETWNGITVGVEVDTASGVTGSEVLRHLSWQRYQGNLLDYGQLVLPLGDGYQSARGRVYDGSPLEIEGVKVLQNGSIHPDFTLFEGEPGESYTPPVSVTGQVTFTQSGSRIQVYNVTTSTEIANEVVSGTTWSLSQLSGSATYWSSGDEIRVRLTYWESATVAMQPMSSTTTVGSSENWSLSFAQESCPVCAAYAIDGSAVSEFAWDGTNVQFDVNDADNEWYVSRLFAWNMYWIFQEVGIRESFGYISALDAGNIRIDNTAALDNLKSVTAMQGDQIRLFRQDGTLPVVNPTTGGGGFTFYSTGTIYLVESGTSGLTPSESSQLDSIASTVDGTGTRVKSNVDAINDIDVTGSGTEADPWGP